MSLLSIFFIFVLVGYGVSVFISSLLINGCSVLDALINSTLNTLILFVITVTFKYITVLMIILF